jgi:DNA polymerase III epsilon subunit family exonuclease
MSGFISKFNMQTGNKFVSLRLSEINLYPKKKEAEFVFAVPENYYEEFSLQKNEILRGVNQSFSTAFSISIKLKNSHFDEYVFKQDVIKFFDSFPSLKSSISNHQIEIEEKDQGTCDNIRNIQVKLLLRPSIYGNIISRNLDKNLRDYIYNSYCDNILLSFFNSDEDEKIVEEEVDRFEYDDDGGRCIVVENRDGLIGHPIFDKATYICDADESEKVVLCGRISNFSERERAEKDGKKQCNFFKFQLDDGTGQMSCLFFANEKNYEKVKKLVNNSEIIAIGKLKSNTYMGATTLSFFINRISTCTLPAEIKINRLKRKPNSSYKYIFPKEYSEYNQSSIFSEDESAPEFLNGKEFCVFDIETTGLSREYSAIIEFGAAKIVDGKIVEIFETLIDPKIDIPPESTKIHGITNAQVSSCRPIEDIFCDIQKFLGDSILVGHNIEFFDFPFLSRDAEKVNIYFDNERIDTLQVAKKYLSLHDYKLNTIAAHFGIENEQAHRASSDAVTTAKVFIKLASFL